MLFNFKLLLDKTDNVPGVYEMLSAGNEVLYIGKAKALKKRLASYFRKSTSAKTQALIARVAHIRTTIVTTEAEALLLECELIKQHQPKYNIVLRDDKSYPYIRLNDKDEFPYFEFYRGAKTTSEKFFGPYANAKAVRKTLKSIQKVFQIRDCNNTYFKNRSRPCLQHQIGRCSAPCVGLIGRQAYATDVAMAYDFLRGQEQRVFDYYLSKMESAASDQQYERAAGYRNRITQLRTIQNSYRLDNDHKDIDLFAIHSQGGRHCVFVSRLRDSHFSSSQYRLIEAKLDETPSEILRVFLLQFYSSEVCPKTIICSILPENTRQLEDILRNRIGKRVHILHQPRGNDKKWLVITSRNAHKLLNDYLNSSTQDSNLVLFALPEQLGIAPIELIEGFDISHLSGNQTIASCVVYDRNGINRQEYRRFNVPEEFTQDDYASLKFAVWKRYRSADQEKIPGLLLIDGGKGQLTRVREMTDELGLTNLPLLGIAKGPGRKPGLEKLFLCINNGIREVVVDAGSFRVLQFIRDESHRFAITGHRRKRQKSLTRSILEDISGIGGKKRQSLLRHFGGLQELKQASVEQLMGVNGINKELAARVYEHLH